MKILNSIAVEIFEKLVNLTTKGNKKSIKIDNNKKGSCIMPISIEIIGKIRIGKYHFKMVSIAHYYEQEGDLMADPEMIFLYNTNLPSFVIPYYYKQDSLQIEEYSIHFDEMNKFKGYYPKMQKEHCYFANGWLRTIKIQQNL